MSQLLKTGDSDLYRIEQLAHYMSGLRLTENSKLLETVSALQNLFQTYGDRFEQLLPHISGPEMPAFIRLETDTMKYAEADAEATAMLHSLHSEPITLEAELTELDLAFEQGHRLTALDIERTVGGVTVKTNFYFADPTPPAKPMSVDIEVNNIDAKVREIIAKKSQDEMSKVKDAMAAALDQPGKHKVKDNAGREFEVQVYDLHHALTRPPIKPGDLIFDFSSLFAKGGRLPPLVAKSLANIYGVDTERQAMDRFARHKANQTEALTLNGVRQELSERIQNNYSSLVNDTDNVAKDVRELSKFTNDIQNAGFNTDQRVTRLNELVERLHKEIQEMRAAIPSIIIKAHEDFLSRPNPRSRS